MRGDAFADMRFNVCFNCFLIYTYIRKCLTIRNKQTINILTFKPHQMKKLLYSLMGCAALLTVGTATGRDAIAQVYSNVAASLGEDGTTTGEYLKSASVVDLTVKYDPVADQVKLTFTSPRLAYWSISGDYEDITAVDAIRIYRNEGEYYNEAGRELVHEFKNVPIGTDLEWADESNVEHGKYWYYMVIPVIAGNEGATAGYSTKVGRTIDPATDFVIIPGEQGAIEATVKFTAPTTANEGAVQVTEPFTAELTRKKDDWSSSEEVIHTFENVEPGSEQSYTDRDTETLVPGQKYQYRIVLYYDGNMTRNWNNYGSVLIGPDMPHEPVDVVAVEEGGNVKVTWGAPVRGVNDGWFDPAAVRYKVERGVPAGYSYDYTEIATELDALEYIDTEIVEEGIYRYRISSMVDGVVSRSNSSEDVIAGPPAKMPWQESWVGGRSQHSTWEKTSNWSVATKTTIYDNKSLNNDVLCEVLPFDSDGGFLLLQAYSYSHEVGDKESAVTGRIDFKDVVDPVLIFSYFDLDPEYTNNDLKVYVSADGGDFVELDVDTQSGPGLNKWVTLNTSLSRFVGAEFIKVKFEVTLGDQYAKVAIDAVGVRERIPVDISNKGISMPTVFYSGSTMDASVVLENLGDDDSEPLALTLTIDGEDLAYSEFASIKNHSTVTIDVPVVIAETIPAGKHTIQVNVESSPDATTDNNTSEVEVEVVALPAASNLAHNDGVLTWDAAGELPFSDGDKAVNELFIDYEHGTTGSFGDWTFIDRDGVKTYTIPGATLDYPNKETEISGMVLYPSLLGASWDTPEERGACFIFVGCQGNADDWLISPQLNGLAQTVTFKAAAAASWGSEYFDVYVSAAGKSIDSFTKLQAYKLPGNKAEEWTEYSVELPAGTKYFAINCVSSYGDALCVTDFQFVTGYGLTSDPTEFLGYNVYCNAEKVNDEVLTTTSFKLPEVVKQGDYTVKAVYNNAESQATDPVHLEGTSGVADVNAEGTLLKVEGTTLLISGNGAYAVVDLAGRTVAAGNGAARVAAAAGTYVVTVDGTVFKVVLK